MAHIVEESLEERVQAIKPRIHVGVERIEERHDDGEIRSGCHRLVENVDIGGRAIAQAPL